MIAAVQKYAHFVELEKCCQTHIFLQNFVLIQPRTSPPKIWKIFEKWIFEKCIFEKCIFEKSWRSPRPPPRRGGRPRCGSRSRRPPRGPRGSAGGCGAETASGTRRASAAAAPAEASLGKLTKFCKILQIFGGLVLGCIKTKFCKIICA